MGQSSKTNTPAAKRRQQSKKGEHGYIHETHLSCRVQHEISPDNYRQNPGRLYEYTGGIIRNLNGSLIEIGGIENHLHILMNLSPAKSVSDSIRDIKANASKWANDRPEVKSRFEWQKSYGAFTVSFSQIDAVRHTIRNQPEHHRTTSFEEETINILRRHEIEFDRKYLFETEHHG